MINLAKHTINLGTGDVGVSIVQGGSVEKPVPVFAFYNRDNENERNSHGLFQQRQYRFPHCCAPARERCLLSPAEKETWGYPGL